MQFADAFNWLPFEIFPFNFIDWLWVLLFVLAGVTIGWLSRREDFVLPQKIGERIKPGTIGQYIIAICFSLFLQAYGILPIAAGLYAGSLGTAANQIQKVYGKRMTINEMQEKLTKLSSEVEKYKELAIESNNEDEQRAVNKFLELIKKRPNEIGEMVLKILGFGGTAEPIMEITTEVAQRIVETVISSEEQRETAIIEEAEMTMQQAKDLLRKAKKKKIFSR